MRRGLLLILFVATALGPPLWAAVKLPQPSHYVEDYAQVINDNHERSLNGLLQELEQKTGTQYIVLTIPSLQGEPIENLGIRLAHDEWKLGQADKDNGLLFILAIQDKKYRFEVGYGLEGIVPDAYVGRIGREVLAPAMRANRASEGIYQSTLQVVQRLAQDAGIQLTGMPELRAVPAPSRRQSRRTLPCCSFLPLLLIFLVFFGGGGRGGSWLLWPLLFGSMGRHHHSGFGGFGGGGFGGFGGGGGGFGGFSGGGGGGFGGGGASGGW
jgi:uncharacterized protein